MRKYTFGRLLIVLLLAAVFAASLSLTACGAPAKVPDDPGQQTTPGEEESGYKLEYGDTLSLTGSVTVADAEIATYDSAAGVLTAVGTGKTTLTVDGEDVGLTVSPALVDVVLFTGQSNMVGRETSKYEVSIPSGQAYEYKYLTQTLAEVKNPVGEDIDKGKNGEITVSSGSSIVPQFCADYVALTGRKIVAVHAARGGRPISYFEQSGAIYPNIIKKYDACIDKLTADDNFTVGRKFYIMLQGESDTNNSTAATKETYKTKYMSFHDGLKDDLGMEFGAMIYTGKNTVADETGIVRIAQAKCELAYEHEDIIVIEKAPMTWWAKNPEYTRASANDNTHFSAVGLKKIASDSCVNLVNFLGYGGDKTKTGVDPVTYLPEPIGVAGFEFPQAAADVVVGQILRLGCAFTSTPDTFTDGDALEPVNTLLTWSSSKPAVATVADGVVTGVAAGSAVIKATSVEKPLVSAEITIRVTAGVQTDVMQYRWDFATDMTATKGGVTATKAGAGEPTFDGGRYSWTDRNNKMYYTLSKPIGLAKEKDWYVEWKGINAAFEGTNNASILLAGDNNDFITYQQTHGIYLRDSGAAANVAKFNDQAVKDKIYEEHTWKLAYSAATNTVELLIDGAAVKSLPWNWDLTISTLLGRPNDSDGQALHFTGSLDYPEIGVSA